MKKSCFLLLIILISLTSYPQNQTFSYVALGDSYTIGEGVKKNKRWPNLLVKHLQEKSIEIELIANPSRTGWTTSDLIKKELSVFKSSNPDFATLLIGVNDWVQGVSVEKFRANFVFILDEILKELPSAERLLAITIPDFSVTPKGKNFANGRSVSAGISKLNAIIIEECKKKNISVVDIFVVSQEMGNNPDLICADGLHPSAKEYEIWEKLIFPVAYDKLK
ncbi:MAG: hypothetical protein COA57_05465 [Flavobacteriales bacterium]|nr:MAG: hypothetical protein COA57_05465 [Flavobacteriales bacterium]